MPKYTFKCSLGHSVQKNVPSSIKAFPCTTEVCSAVMERQMPSTSTPNVTEVIDKYTGTTWKDGQKDLIKERHDEFYWSVEVPRMVNSGIYSVETMLENGWITLDDSGHLHTNTKPPNKR